MSKSLIEVKKGHALAEARMDPWQSLRKEMSRLLNRFDMDFHWPSFDQAFALAPHGSTSTFELNTPLVDVAESE